MNDNFKHALLNLYLFSSTIAVSSTLLSYQTNLSVPISVFSLLVLGYVVLSFFFFGSARFIENTFGFLAKSVGNIVAIATIVLGFYSLTINPESLEILWRIVLLIVFLASWSFVIYKARNFSNLKLIKSFFKENLQLVDGWVATETDNEQQADYREVPLKGKSIKKLVFTIIHSSPFWRAGFKLTDPNGSILPLRTDKSLLFHLGSTEDESRFGITAYMDGKWVESLNKNLPHGKQKTINITFEVSEKNFIKCYVNGEVEFEPTGRIDPHILKKAFLAAWGDGHNMRVEFDGIGFSTR